MVKKDRVEEDNDQGHKKISQEKMGLQFVLHHIDRGPFGRDFSTAQLEIFLAATGFMVQQNVGKCKYNKRIEVIMYNLNGRGGEGVCIKCIGKRGECIENCEKCKKCPNL